MESIAHIRQLDGKVQTVEEHLNEVKELSQKFGSKIGVPYLAGLAGWLHDLGKYSEEFVDYIIEAVNNPDHPPKKGSVDHSTAGGKFLYQLLHSNSSVQGKMIAEIVGNVIISHHMGLQDFLTPELESDYIKRVDKKAIEAFQLITERFHKNVTSKKGFETYLEKCEEELSQYIKNNVTKDRLNKVQLILTFLIKYIFSCLIDADRTNTRCFEENTNPNEMINNQQLFEQHYQKLINYLDTLNVGKESKTQINILRAKMSNECDDFASRTSGIYTLSMPTGGGKTLASLRYALKHSILNKKERIIYVVPYTTIIEQNADEVRRILDDMGHILEHHSNVVEKEDMEESPLYVKNKPLKLAKDNWDAPIIFTTMVQFLNAFYSGGTRNIRRLHNLANSVIIFDEVQSVPIKCVSLFNEALNFLKNTCHSCILLCTATQPALDFVEKSVESIDGEVVQDLGQIADAFKRVEIVDKTSNKGWSTEDLSDFIHERFTDSSSILVILNTKTVVRNLFNRIKSEEPDLLVYHLSTSMCAAHRKDILRRVKATIRKGEKVVCISTQLIEAGVDISFDCVIRSLAGLDSIAQAAGRCNRHGEQSIRNVYVINHNEESLKYLKEIKIGAAITERILKDRTHKDGIQDILSPEAISLYFKNYYHEFENELNYNIPPLHKNMYDLLNTNKDFVKAFKNKYGEPFNLVLNTSIKTASQYFDVIDNHTTSVLVPYKEGMELIAELNEDLSIGDMASLMKDAQQYIVNVYQHDINELSKNGNVYYLREGKILCLRENAYDQSFGVSIEGDGVMEGHFI